MNLRDAFVLDDVRRTSDGYLTAFARVARTGIQEYRGHELGRPDLDVVRVYRPPEEVFAPDAMSSFAHRPVTLRHPKTPVNAKNWKKYAGGQTGAEVVRDAEYIRIPMVLMDQKLIDAYERDGIKQLSMGYSTDIKWRTGVVDAGQPDAGQQYDAVQTAIRGNHLAIVPDARGGDQLRIGDGRTALSALIRQLRDMDEDIDDDDEGEGDYVGDASMLYDTTFTSEQRKKLAESGAAMPGGGFPIRNTEDLHHAMEAIGRAKNPNAARAHIRSRAKALGLEGELSASFKTDAAPSDDEIKTAALAACRSRGVDPSDPAVHEQLARRFGRGDYTSRDDPDRAGKFASASKMHGRAAIALRNNSTEAQDLSAKAHAYTYKNMLDSKSRSDDVDYVDCPQCGAEVPPDSLDCPECGHKMKPTTDGATYMTKIVIDGVPVNVADEQTAAIIDRHMNLLTKQLADAKKELDKVENEGEDKDKEIEDAKKTISAKDGEIAVLKKQVADAAVTPDKLDVMVKDRLAVIDSAMLLLDKTFAFDGKTIEAIRRAAVDANLGDAAKGMDDAAVGGAFAALTADAANRTRGGSQPIRQALFSGGRQTVGDARQTAFDEKQKRQSEAWRGKATA